MCVCGKGAGHATPNQPKNPHPTPTVHPPQSHSQTSTPKPNQTKQTNSPRSYHVKCVGPKAKAPPGAAATGGEGGGGSGGDVPYWACYECTQVRIYLYVYIYVYIYILCVCVSPPWKDRTHPSTHPSFSPTPLHRTTPSPLSKQGDEARRAVIDEAGLEASAEADSRKVMTDGPCVFYLIHCLSWWFAARHMLCLGGGACGGYRGRLPQGRHGLWRFCLYYAYMIAINLCGVHARVWRDGDGEEAGVLVLLIDVCVSMFSGSTPN